MKVLPVLILLIGIGSIGYSQSFFDRVGQGHWTGTGTLLGSTAEFEMRWEKVLDGKFIKLTFRNSRTTEKDVIELKANGYYQVVNDTLVNGTWFDSRGMVLPLKGTLSSDKLTIQWGDENTERGQTVYIMKPSGIYVEDYVMIEGKPVKFGTASYKK